MPDPNLCDLMSRYARQGIAHWEEAEQGLKKKANEILGNAIAENEWEANKIIYTVSNQGGNGLLRFIPMPESPGGKNIDWCFFHPICKTTENGQNRAYDFELFLLVKEKNWVSFRFEPADAPPSTHGYDHVQFCHKVLRKTLAPTGVPPCVPDSYPAFPLPSSNPLQLFLLMVTTIHGYQGGMTSVLQEIFQDYPALAVLYVDELKKLLN